MDENKLKEKRELDFYRVFFRFTFPCTAFAILINMFFELLNNNKLEGTERYGIFRIGIYADHSLTYLLLLNDGNHMFLDCFADLSQTLNSVFIYFERVGNQLTDAQKLLYIHKIVDVYIRNRNCIPW